MTTTEDHITATDREMTTVRVAIALGNSGASSVLGIGMTTVEIPAAFEELEDQIMTATGGIVAIEYSFYRSAIPQDSFLRVMSLE